MMRLRGSRLVERMQGPICCPPVVVLKRHLSRHLQLCLRQQWLRPRFQTGLTSCRVSTRFQMRLARCYGSGLTILEMCKPFDINKSPYVRQELLKADATVHAIHLPAEESRKSNLKLPSLMYGDASGAKVAIRRSTCSGSVRSIRLAGQQEGFQSRKYSSIHILKRVEIAGDQDRPVSLCNGGN